MTHRYDPPTVEVSRLPSAGTPPRPSRPPRRLWPSFAVLAVVVLLLVGAGVVAYRELWPQSDATGSQASDGEAVNGFTVYDQFDGPSGSRIDSSSWSYDTGQTGWGNNEKQNYTDSVGNAYQDGSGNMSISALRTPDGYTSARVTTKDKFEFTYGRVEARIKMPAGAGLHPAFWMLGTDIDDVGWPISGEIDVIETLNEADNYHIGVHAPQADSLNSQRVQLAGYPANNLADEYHVYWVEKSPQKIVIGMDDQVLQTVTPADLDGGSEYWVFDKPFYLLFNVAVAGDWPGPTDADTEFPATMSVDWVRYRTD